MGRKRNSLYRIKDIATGLYYTGGTGQRLKNPDYNPKAKWPSWNDPNRPLDCGSGRYPWNRTYLVAWDKFGKVMTNLSGCEKIISRLSQTSKHMRQTKAQNILFGNQKSNNLKIVRCRIVDIKDGEETE